MFRVTAGSPPPAAGGHGIFPGFEFLHIWMVRTWFSFWIETGPFKRCVKLNVNGNVEIQVEKNLPHLPRSFWDFQTLMWASGCWLNSFLYTFKRLQSSSTSWGGKSIAIASVLMISTALGRTYPRQVLSSPENFTQIVTAATWRTFDVCFNCGKTTEAARLSRPRHLWNTPLLRTIRMRSWCS